MPGPDLSALAIAFGDFKAGYLINDRIGTRNRGNGLSDSHYARLSCGIGGWRKCKMTLHFSGGEPPKNKLLQCRQRNPSAREAHLENGQQL